MSTIENPILWLLGIPALGILLFLLRGHFSANARSQHRRGQSHRPVISQEHSPAVSAGKPRRDLKR